MTILGTTSFDNSYRSASLIMLKLLAATQRIANLRNVTISTISKCKQMQIRGRKIACMNKIRMSILKQMWNDQKYIMIKNLQMTTKKKEVGKKKRL